MAWMLVGFSLVSYIARMNISVAAEFMQPELGLTSVQMGQIFSAFLLGYAAFQIPLGMLGDRFGPHVMLVGLGATWAVLTVLTGFLPGTITGAGTGAFVTLLAIRFLLGVSVAGVYPLCARGIANWHPLAERAFAYSLVIAGVSIGSAVTPPIVAWSMVNLGWRGSFYVCAVLAAVLAVVWWQRGGDGPSTTPRITADERAYIQAGQEHGDSRQTLPKGLWLKVLGNRSMLLMTLSYFLAGYTLYVFVFWFFRYLREVREFTIAGGSLGTMMPFIVAGILSPLGGAICDRLTTAWGPRRGRRTVGMFGVAMSATCVLIGIYTTNAYLAVAALSLAFGFAMFAESGYWSTAMDIGGKGTGVATGVINTANNVGGVVSTAMTPVLFERFGWETAFVTCAVLSYIAALLWLGVKADERIDAVDAPARGAALAPDLG